MKIELIAIYDRGNLSQERLHFRALSDIDLRYYAVFDTFYTEPDKIQATQKTCYWFPPKLIKAGENVVLYTRGGNESRETKNDGKIYNFIFRGLNAPLYLQREKCAVLFEIQSWITTKMG